MSRFREFTGRLRGMMHREPGTAAPAARPFTWEAPLEGGEEPRDPAAGLSVETLPLRPEPRLEPRPERRPEPRPEPLHSRGGSGGTGESPQLSRGAGFIPAPRDDDPRGAHWRTKADVTDFKAVYAEAGITSPPHGYGVEKVAEMLSSPHLGSRPRDVRATAALAALEAARVPLRDVIDDAVLRHKALAAFESAKELELHATMTRSRSRIDALQEQVRLFLASRNGEIDSLNRAVQAARQQLAQLQARKQREEDRLLRVLTHFVEPRPAPAPIARGAVVSPMLPADPALKPAAEAPRPAPPPVPAAAGLPAPAAPPKPGPS